LLWATARDGLDRQWALSLLRKAYEISGDTRALLRLYDAALNDDPRDLVTRNNLAAACFLVSTNLPAAHRWAEHVYAAQPTNAAFACTYAYSLHLQGRSKDALTVLERLPEQATRAPGLAAYYGVILHSEGRGQAAERYFALAMAGRSALLPEEFDLVRRRSRVPAP
jgi:tetratricopeptide (TPR) repeat protein